MKVLLCGPLIANAGHGAECGVYDALQELGYEVSAWDYRKNVFIAPNGETTKHSLDERFPDQYDLVLCLGPGLPDSVLLSFGWGFLESSLKVLWNSEPILLESYRNKISCNKSTFDYFFTFDECELPVYKEVGINNVSFLPQAFNPKWYKPLGIPMIRHFCFVGSVGGKWMNRQYFLDRVSKFCKERHLGVFIDTCFEANKVNEIYNQHVAVLNLGLYHGGPVEELRSYGLQQRIFEAIGAGKVVITNEVPNDSNQLFTHGKDILFYNGKNLEEILGTALDPNVRKSITENVLQIREHHTYKARMAQMFSILKKAGKI